ncbi:Rho guanine nucleotide exchange factor 4 [Actinomortierella wolfii]|nr:Rho guanine nucleotide exchange factor 4 [Actinomortierella wolfii]
MLQSLQARRINKPDAKVLRLPDIQTLCPANLLPRAHKDAISASTTSGVSGVLSSTLPTPISIQSSVSGFSPLAPLDADHSSALHQVANISRLSEQASTNNFHGDKDSKEQHSSDVSNTSVTQHPDDGSRFNEQPNCPIESDSSRPQSVHVVIGGMAAIGGNSITTQQLSSERPNAIGNDALDGLAELSEIGRSQSSMADSPQSIRVRSSIDGRIGDQISGRGIGGMAMNAESPDTHNCHDAYSHYEDDLGQGGKDMEDTSTLDALPADQVLHPMPAPSPENIEAETRRHLKRTHALRELVATEENYVEELDSLVNSHSCHLYGGFCDVREKTLRQINKVVSSSTYIAFQNKCKERFLLRQQERHATQMSSTSIPRLKDIKDFLIKPIQRICRYPLLVQELIRLTKETDEEFKDLANMLVVAKAMAAHVDEAQKLYERRQKTDKFIDNVPEVSTPRKASQYANIHCSYPCYCERGSGSNPQFSTGGKHILEQRRSSLGHTPSFMRTSISVGVTEPGAIACQHSFANSCEGINSDSSQASIPVVPTESMLPKTSNATTPTLLAPNEVVYPSSLTRTYLKTLGPLLMLNVLEVYHLNNLPVRSKIYGCVIFETMLIMISPKKANAFEPRHWLPLRLLEIDEFDAALDDTVTHSALFHHLDERRNFCWRLTFGDHIFLLSALNAEEKAIWVTVLRTQIEAAKRNAEHLRTLVSNRDTSGTLAATLGCEGEDAKEEDESEKVHDSTTTTSDSVETTLAHHAKETSHEASAASHDDQLHQRKRFSLLDGQSQTHLCEESHVCTTLEMTRSRTSSSEGSPSALTIEHKAKFKRASQDIKLLSSSNSGSTPALQGSSSLTSLRPGSPLPRIFSERRQRSNSDVARNSSTGSSGSSNTGNIGSHGSLLTSSRESKIIMVRNLLKGVTTQCTWDIPASLSAASSPSLSRSNSRSSPFLPTHITTVAGAVGTPGCSSGLSAIHTSPGIYASEFIAPMLSPLSAHHYPGASFMEYGGEDVEESTSSTLTQSSSGQAHSTFNTSSLTNRLLRRRDSGGKGTRSSTKQYREIRVRFQYGVYFVVDFAIYETTVSHVSFGSDISAAVTSALGHHQEQQHINHNAEVEGSEETSVPPVDTEDNQTMPPEKPPNTEGVAALVAAAAGLEGFSQDTIESLQSAAIMARTRRTTNSSDGALGSSAVARTRESSVSSVLAGAAGIGLASGSSQPGTPRVLARNSLVMINSPPITTTGRDSVLWDVPISMTSPKALARSWHVDSGLAALQQYQACPIVAGQHSRQLSLSFQPLEVQSNQQHRESGIERMWHAMGRTFGGGRHSGVAGQSIASGSSSLNYTLSNSNTSAETNNGGCAAGSSRLTPSKKRFSGALNLIHHHDSHTSSAHPISNEGAQSHSQNLSYRHSTSVSSNIGLLSASKAAVSGAQMQVENRILARAQQPLLVADELTVYAPAVDEEATIRANNDTSSSLASMVPTSQPTSLPYMIQRRESVDQTLSDTNDADNGSILGIREGAQGHGQKGKGKSEWRAAHSLSMTIPTASITGATMATTSGAPPTPTKAKPRSIINTAFKTLIGGGFGGHKKKPKTRTCSFSSSAPSYATRMDARRSYHTSSSNIDGSHFTQECLHEDPMMDDANLSFTPALESISRVPSNSASEHTSELAMGQPQEAREEKQGGEVVEQDKEQAADGSVGGLEPAVTELRTDVHTANSVSQENISEEDQSEEMDNKEHKQEH